jgi:hypothetical protein
MSFAIIPSTMMPTAEAPRVALDYVEAFDRRRAVFRKDRLDDAALALLFTAANDDRVALRNVRLRNSLRH